MKLCQQNAVQMALDQVENNMSPKREKNIIENSLDRVYESLDILDKMAWHAANNHNLIGLKSYIDDVDYNWSQFKLLHADKQYADEVSIEAKPPSMHASPINDISPTIPTIHSSDNSDLRYFKDKNF
jgi:hypothetical protein